MLELYSTLMVWWVIMHQVTQLFVFMMESLKQKLLKLQGTSCDCCYSYLDDGSLTFHDEGGDVPYVKRLLSGTVATAGVVALPKWKAQTKTYGRY